MQYYKIADLIISMEPDARTERQAKPYLLKGEHSAEFHVAPKSKEEFLSRTDLKIDFSEFQYLSCCQSFHLQIFNYNGMYVHSSAVVVDDKAYLFSAPSGTGKSTHTSLWLKKFGDRAFILNDDKPVLRYLKDTVYAYGTPWCGKCDISANKKVEVAGLCFIKRDTNDWIKPLNKKEAAIKLYQASSKKMSQNLIPMYFNVINRIVDNVNVFEMGCTPTLNAVEVAYKAMYRE